MSRRTLFCDVAHSLAALSEQDPPYSAEQNSAINEIFVTDDEKTAGKLTVEYRDSAVAALNNDGYVVLHGIVDKGHLDLLKERMLADLEKILARPDAPFNFNTGNVQQDPPPFAPYLFDDVLKNDLVIEVTSTVLGPGLKNGFYSGNTALPGGNRQPVHPDAVMGKSGAPDTGLWVGGECAGGGYVSAQ